MRYLSGQWKITLKKFCRATKKNWFARLHDLYPPNANSKPWIDSETVSAIRRKDKLFKKHKKFGLETDKDHFGLARTALQKAISKKNNFFKKKLKRMLIVLKNYGKILCP